MSATSLVACSGNHHVSPFPDIDPNEVLRPLNDLDAHVARATREAQASGLEVALRVDGKGSGSKRFVALGLVGKDAFGRAIRAVRVATPASIVLAIGPPALDQRDPSEPNELLESLLDGGGFPSGVDLTGDGAPDIALRAEDGTLAIYRIDPLGATRYPVVLDAKPTQVLDANGDGRPDLAGVLSLPGDADALSLSLLDVAICAGTSFRNDHPDALAYHQKLRDRPPPPDTEPKPARLRAAIERAFHSIRAGDDVNTAMQPALDLAQKLAPLDEPRAASRVRWRGTLVDLAATKTPKE
jgi:hypothetical protein